MAKEATPPNQEEQQHPQQHVCLFGISADPPTGTAGHVGIVKQLLSYFRMDDTSEGPPLVDQIRILPVYRHTYVDKRNRLIAFEHRMELCRRAFSNLSPQVVVATDEYESWKRAAAAAEASPGHSTEAVVVVGTAALLEYLQEQEPSTVFSFCLGADSFISLVQGKWKESERVLQLLQGRFIVVNRVYDPSTTTPDDDDKNIQQTKELETLVQSVPGARLLPPNPELGSVSSSQIRALLQDPIERQALLSKRLHNDKEETNPSNDETMIASSVLEYIQEHGLYEAS